jgi:subtilisin family serine protease
MPVRVAIIDSGVNPYHPHVAPISGGVRITQSGTDGEFLDFLGHGTAVAGAIREKAPHAEIYAVKIFDRALVAPGYFVLRALDWCVEHGMDLINLSLGTLNRKYLEGFESRISRAKQLGSTIVAAFEMDSRPALPGSLTGVVGVVMDETFSREQVVLRARGDCKVYAASSYPRPIPGVPPKHNLHGISFAVANVTGHLASQRQTRIGQP